MLKAKVAVLVSGGGTNLQQLLDAASDGRLTAGEIAVVVADNAEAYALERAKLAKVPAVAIDKKAADFEQQLDAVLREYQVDLIVLAGFLTILSGTFTADWQDKIINVHPSLIPSFCGKGFYGLKVHQAALDYGVKVTGATVHFVNEVTDGGRIIMQKAVDILPDDNAESLQRRVMEEAEWVILPEATELLCQEIISKSSKK